MRTGISVAIALACCLAAGETPSRAQATPPPAGSQTKRADGQKPPANAPKPAESNPFPEDTTTVPVMPNATSPASDVPAWDGTNPAAAVPGEDNDPVRSPEDPLAGASSGSAGDSSSSITGLDHVINPPDDAKGKDSKKPPEHQETAAEDENVGSYYLSTKNWRAALSRYQSALVLDPENPEVYWGLAEAQRHLGELANAKANYSKVVEYDPDSRHGKEARKALKDPELANAPTASVARPPATTHP